MKLLVDFHATLFGSRYLGVSWEVKCDLSLTPIVVKTEVQDA